MKKLVFALAAMLASAAFAPLAQAVPAFARQTGFACSQCHQQHYPVLNSFGQSFKASGYTMMGAQAKVEGDHLSLPGTLNAAVLLKARYQKTNGNDTDVTGGETTNSGQIQIPDEFSLFFGGRVADSDTLKIGFMMENNLVGGPLGGIVAGFKLPIVFEQGEETRIMVIPYLTDALGQAYGFEQSSTGMTRGIRWAEHRMETSAAQYTGLGSGTASGMAFVAASEMGYVNLSRWSPQFAYAGGETGVRMSSTWLRVAATPTVGEWAMHIGVGVSSGTSSCHDPFADPVLTAPLAGGTVSSAPDPTSVIGANDCETRGSVVDFQGHGMIGGKPAGVYVQYATAPASDAGVPANLFNPNDATARKALTVGADYSVVPNVLHIGAAVRLANTGMTTADEAAGKGDKDNALTLTAVYDVTQNVALHANYSKYSGSAYDANGTNAVANNVTGDPYSGTSLLTFMLEAAW
jgi:hypothetical protein